MGDAYNGEQTSSASFVHDSLVEKNIFGFKILPVLYVYENIFMYLRVFRLGRLL